MAESTRSSKSTFDKLNAVDVSGKSEKKNGLTYLSWAWAWTELKKICPTAQYKVYETDSGCIYHTDGKTCWVKVSVTVDDLEHIEYLPIMDFRNNAIPVDKVTSFDANKAIQRAITKACARHGLGLYIYAGEDLPDESTAQSSDRLNGANKQQIAVCTVCNKEIVAAGGYTAEAITAEAVKKLGKPVCLDCWRKMAEKKKEESK